MKILKTVLVITIIGICIYAFGKLGIDEPPKTTLEQEIQKSKDKIYEIKQNNEREERLQKSYELTRQ